MSIEQIMDDTLVDCNLNWKLDIDYTGRYVTTSEDTGNTYYLDFINTGMYRVIKVVDSNIDLHLYSSQSHEVLREHCCRGGRGIDGRQPPTWVKIKDINDNWLNSLITYCEDLGQYGSIHYLMYLDELEYRKTHNITITGEQV